MQYRISILESNTFTPEIYTSREDAENAYSSIQDKCNYWIAEILSESEIIEQKEKIDKAEIDKKEQEEERDKKEKQAQEEISVVKVKWLYSESGYIEINGKTYVDVSLID